MSLPNILTASAALENANKVALGINHAYDEPPEVLTDLPVAVRFAEPTPTMEASDLMGRYNIFHFKIEVHLARGVLQESYANALPMIRRYQNLYAANLSIGISCDVSGFREPACSGPVRLRYGTEAVETIGVIFYMWAKEILDDITVALGDIMYGDGGAWTLIAETIVPAGPGVASVTFAAIPGTYRALGYFFRIRSDRAAENETIAIRFNGDGGNNYAWQQFYSAGGVMAAIGGAPVSELRIGLAQGANGRANTFGVGTGWLYAYADTNMETNVRAVSFNERSGTAIGNASPQSADHGGFWANTAVVTQITFIPITGPNFVANSRIALYGIT